MENKHKSINILLVDDDTTNLSSIKEYLEDIHGYSVTGSTSGNEALQLLEKNPKGYSILLVDWTIKPLSGEDLLESVKKNAPDIPVIIFTGNAEAGAVAFQKGAYAYFRKPVDTEELVQTINEAIRENGSSGNQVFELINISSLLIEQQTLDGLAKAIVKKAVDILGASLGCFFLWNWSNGKFEVLAQTGCEDLLEKQNMIKHILDRFTKEKKTILNYPESKGKLPAFLMREKISSYSFVFLQRADLLLGLLVLGKREGVFTKEDEITLRSLQVMVESLLERAKVRKNLQVIDQQNLIPEEDLRKLVVNGIFELLGKPTALWLLERGYLGYRIVNSAGMQKKPKRDNEIISDNTNSLVVASINEKEPISWKRGIGLLQNPLPVEFQYIGDQQIESALVVPLLTFEGSPLGAITIFAKEENAFKEYDIQLVERFATRLSNVLDNYRRQWQSEKLSELSGALIADSKNEISIFNIFSEIMCEITGANNVAIYPYDSRRQIFFDAKHVIIKGALAKEKKEPADRPRERGLAFIVRHVGKVVVDDTQGDINSIHVDYLEQIPSRKKITKSFLQKIIQEEKFIQREKIRAFIGISLKAPQAQAEVGVLYVNFSTPHEFTESEINLLQITARQVASVVHSQRLRDRQQQISSAMKDVIDVIGTRNPLPVILRETAILFSADHGSISRLTGDGQYMIYKSIWKRGKLYEAKKEKRPITNGITGKVVQTGESLRADDVSKVKFYDRWYKSTKSELAIPLNNEFGSIIGVLNLESDYANFFTEEHEELCTSFASAASAAIQQSDLFDAVQALHFFTEDHSLKTLLNQVLTNLNKMMGANTASSVNLYDKTNDNFFAFMGVGPDQEFVEKYLLIPPRKKGGTGRFVLETKKALYYKDTKDIPARYPKIRSEAVAQGILSFAAIPLLYRKEILGVLFIHKIKEQIDFTGDAKSMLQTYTDQVALAIHDFHSRVDIEPLKTILDVTASGAKESVLNLIVENAVNVVSSDYASLWLGNLESGDLVREAIYVREGEKVNLEKRRIYSTEGSINMIVYKTGEPKILNDVSVIEKQGLYNRIYEKAKSEIAVPLVFRGEIIGTLNTESQLLGAYSEFEIETLQIFADVAAIAIKTAYSIEEFNNEVQRQTVEIRRQNEELYHMNYRLERRNASFEALTEIAQQLTANVRRGEKEILTIIHQQASRIMDTDNMYIALYEPGDDLVHFELAFLDGNSVDIAHEDGWAPRSGGHGRTEWIIKNKTPILTYTKVDAENWYNQPNTKEYIGQPFASWLGVPVMFGEDVMGVIATYHKTEDYKYDPDDLKILELMGRQAAIALQNARLIEELDRRVIELDAIRELGEDLSQGTLTIK